MIKPFLSALTVLNSREYRYNPVLELQAWCRLAALFDIMLRLFGKGTTRVSNSSLCLA